jgi:hypothetical protein
MWRLPAFRSRKYPERPVHTLSPFESEIQASGIVDGEWYLEQYPDVRRALLDPVLHFANYGIHEGRQPNPLFTGRWYGHIADPEEAELEEEEAHPLSSVAEIERSGLLDGEWYLDEYADLAAAEVDPASHFASYGIGENRQPNALFSASWYLAKHPEVAASGLDPVLHYIRHGARKGFDPHPLFDSQLYLDNHPGVRRKDALKHFLHGRRAGSLEACMRLPAPLMPIDRYPEAVRNRIRLSPILTALPAVHYLATYLRSDRSRDDGPRSIEEFVERSRESPYQIDTSLRQSNLGIIVEMERRKRRLAAEYSARPQRELISVIMPTHNRPKTVVDAINSLIVQTYRNWELIVVEDGTDCGVESLISTYGDDRICFVRHDVRRGAAAARNTGLDHASGTAIVYLDDDDQYDPDFLLISLNAMRRAGKRMFYSAQMLWHGFDEFTMTGRKFRGVLFCDFNRRLLEQTNYLSMSVVMHDRSLIDMCGRFDEDLTRLVDWDFFLRMTEVETPARLPLVLHHYYQRRTPDSISAINPAEINADRIRSKLEQRRARAKIIPATTGWMAKIRSRIL